MGDLRRRYLGNANRGTLFWGDVHVSEALFILKEGGVEEDDGYLMLHTLYGDEVISSCE